VKKFDDVYERFCTTSALDRQTDRMISQYYAVSTMMSDKTANRP